jgi:battenin
VVFFTLEVIYLFVPSIWIIFAAVLWEGLLGGAAYVNTYYRMSTEVSVLTLLKIFGVSIITHC